MGLVTLAALLVFAVVMFLRTSPHGVDRRSLAVCNAVTLALAVPASAVTGFWLHADAAALKGDGGGMAMILAAMGAGAVALLVICVGGLVRNFVIFPHSRRSRGPGFPPGP